MKSRGGGSDIDLGLGIIDDEVIIGLAVIDQGECGDDEQHNAYYTLYNTGLLEIYGTGRVLTGDWDKSAVVTVDMSDTLADMHTKVFEDHTALVSAKLPNGMSAVHSETFKDCTSLASMELSENVDHINSKAFQGCTSLASITVHATTPPTLHTDALDGCTALTAIYVPYDSVDAYKTAWSNYASVIQPIVTIGDMIDLDTQSYHMYHMTEEDLTAVGIRVYGTQDGISMLTFFADDETQGQTSGYRHMWTKNLSTTLYEGDYMDIYSASIDDSTTEPQSFQTFLAAFAHTDKLWVKQAQQGGDILTQFSFIFKGATTAQSTRTLATDPMIRSTLSTISDTLNSNIEDD